MRFHQKKPALCGRGLSELILATVRPWEMEGAACLILCLGVLWGGIRKHPETGAGSKWKPYLGYEGSCFVANHFFHIKVHLSPSLFLFSHHEHWPHLSPFTTTLHKYIPQPKRQPQDDVLNSFHYTVLIWPSHFLRWVSLRKEISKSTFMYEFIRSVLSLSSLHVHYTQWRHQYTCRQNDVLPVQNGWFTTKTKHHTVLPSAQFA